MLFLFRCSRDSLTRVESIFNDSAPAGPSETDLSRGMKRPALHRDSDVGLQTDSPPSASTVFKKACQKSSPVQLPLRRYACGAKNLIDASYTSIQRFEKRLVCLHFSLKIFNSCQLLLLLI